MTQDWRHGFWKLGIASLVIGGAIPFGIALLTATTTQVKAQVTPDGTLGTRVNNSTLPCNGGTCTITGGTQAGINLFHSFKDFSVRTGEVHFENATSIQNIINRVTGSSRSDINGIISAKGLANVFLINPNGIIFGPNAQLQIGGSFVATTANAMKFGTETFGLTTTASEASLLTVNPSALLFNQIAAQQIAVQSRRSRGVDRSGNPLYEGLTVPNAKSLLLVGGDVRLDGTVVLARGGRVELGGLAEPGTIGLVVDGNNLSLSFPQVGRGDVSLSNGAIVDVSSTGGGSIALNARNLDISGGSSLFAGIISPGKVDAIAGDITVNATGEITIPGGSIYNRVYSGAVGKGGNINITTGSLSVTGGSQLSASTFGQGNAGDVSINARDGVTLDGVGSNGNASGAFSQVADPKAVGSGGNVNVTAESLTVKNGAELSTSTFGQGNAGDVNINVRDAIILDGVDNKGNTSGAFSNVLSGAVGNGGNVNVTAESLSVKNGAELSASTRGMGNAGDVNINVRDAIILDGVDNKGNSSGAFSRTYGNGDGGSVNITTGSLSVTSGAQVSASTFEQGRNAGSVKINARDDVTLDGVGRGSNGNPSGIFSQVNPAVMGKGDVNAGDISIRADRLFIRNGALVNVSNQRSGEAGDIKVTSRRLILDNRGLITATSTQGSGGNIDLQGVREYVVLSRNSRITTTSGSATAGGNGGNITITTPFIIATPQRDSNIIANAFRGNGGKIEISATRLFDIAARQQSAATNDITASSRFGISGVVQINALNIDPSRAFSNLSNARLPELLAEGCRPNGRPVPKDKFYITGRGGLPPNPSDRLSSGAVAEDLGSDTSKLTSEAGKNQEIPSTLPAPDTQGGHPVTAATAPSTEVVEAQGWVRDANGDVYIVAQAPTVTPHSLWRPVTCHEP